MGNNFRWNFCSELQIPAPHLWLETNKKKPLITSNLNISVNWTASYLCFICLKKYLVFWLYIYKKLDPLITYLQSDPLVNKNECLLVSHQLLTAVCIHFYFRKDALREPTVVAVHCCPFCLSVHCDTVFTYLVWFMFSKCSQIYCHVCSNMYETQRLYSLAQDILF